MPKAPQDLRLFAAIEQIVRDLRSPEGCPWDRKQTHQSLAPYAIEETAELVEALELGNDSKTMDELGDVLLQVVLHAQLAAERGAFEMADVIQNISQKMIRRHPHVFGSATGQSAELSDSDLSHQWEKIKQQENTAVAGSATASKGKTTTTADLNIPIHLPALQRSAKIGVRTRRLYFDWPNTGGVLEKVREEIAEMEEAIEEGGTKAIRHELGDVLFSLAQLARHLEFDPEQILREANQRFEKRFAMMLEICKEQNLKWNDLAPGERESLWAQAKKRRKNEESAGS